MSVVQDLILRVRAMGAKAAAAEVEGVGTAAKGMGGAFKTAAGVAGIGAMAFGLKDITSSAIKFQAQSAQLAGALKNMGEFSQENVRRVTEAADTLATHGGFDPQTSIAGMTRLIAAHESVSDAIKNEGLITDIARRSGLSYQTVLRAVMTVEQGRTSGLTRLGIVIHPVVTAQNALTASHKKLTPEMKAQAKQMDQNATRLVAMRELWKRFGGATAEYSRTAAGGANNFKNSVELLGQRVGVFLLPLIQKFIHYLTDGVNWLLKNKTAVHILVDAMIALAALWAATKLIAFIKWIRLAFVTTKLWTAVTWAMTAAQIAFAAATGDATAAAALMGAAMIALDAIPIVALIVGIAAAIAALVLGIIWLINHLKEVGAFFVSIFNGIKHVVGAVVDWIVHHWKYLLLLLGPVGIIALIVIKHFKAIKDFVGGVVDSIVGFFRGLVQTLSPIAQAIWSIVTWPFREVIRIAGSVWGAIKGPLSAIAGAISGAMNALWNILTWPFREAIKFAKLVWHWVNKLLGPLKKVVNFVGNAAGAAGGALGDAANAVGNFLGFAHGGDVATAGAYMVGERGPEIVYMPAGAHVVSNSDLQNGIGAGSPLENHITLQIGTYEFARAIAYTQTKAKAVR